MPEDRIADGEVEVTDGLVPRDCRGQRLEYLCEAKAYKNHSLNEKPNECDATHNHQGDSCPRKGSPYSDIRRVPSLLLPIDLIRAHRDSP